MTNEEAKDLWTHCSCPYGTSPIDCDFDKCKFGESKTDLCKKCKKGEDCEISTKRFSWCRTAQCNNYEEADNETDN